MAKMLTDVKNEFKTRPLDSWSRAGELRTQLYKNMCEAREKGKLLVAGGTAIPYELMAGLGDFEVLAGETYGGMVATDDSLALECFEALEAEGHGREGCGYYRLMLGSMFLGRGPWGDFPRPDLVVQLNACDSQGKSGQVVAEHFDVPLFCFDVPLTTFMEPATRDQYVDYFASQYHDFVDWVQRVTGRTYDDERLIAAINNTTRSHYLWARICILNQAVPAPLDERALFTLFTPLLLNRDRPEVVAFYEGLLDEVQDRVNNGISALGVEKYRLLHEGQPPWFNLGLFRYPARYGAVFVGSVYTFCIGQSPYVVGPEGNWEPKKPPAEQGITLRTREEALRFLAEWNTDAQFFKRILHVPGKLETVFRAVREWHAQGVVIHLNRGCPGYNEGNMELRMALQKEGIPCMTYEASMTDRRDFTEAPVMDAIDTFMESL
ncbi:MAG: 2-hydroxyacyl-CoA dehydratase family protein [Dehalococcoidia bacterium]